MFVVYSLTAGIIDLDHNNEKIHRDKKNLNYIYKVENPYLGQGHWSKMVILYSTMEGLWTLRRTV